jgi:hypothetical protein
MMGLMPMLSVVKLILICTYLSIEELVKVEDKKVMDIFLADLSVVLFKEATGIVKQILRKKNLYLQFALQV